MMKVSEGMSNLLSSLCLSVGFEGCLRFEPKEGGAFEEATAKA